MVTTHDRAAAEKERQERYRRQVRETFQQFSDQALAYQDGIIRGGIDREECDREIMRRLASREAR